jgi:uncharacterized protein (TIGR02646 family)
MNITVLTRQEIKAAEAAYWAQPHPTKIHRAATRKLLAFLAERSRSTKIDGWRELESIDPATWGKKISASHLKTGFRNYIDGIQGGRCSYCRTWLIGGARHIEHVLPRATYPQHSLCFWNLTLACADCNSIKSDRVWGGIPQKRRLYPKPERVTEFFHPRYHRYDEHIRYVMVETNSGVLTIYKGLTEQGRHLCTELLHKVAARRTLYANNPALRKSKEALDAYQQIAGAATHDVLKAFQTSLDASVARFIA